MRDVKICWGSNPGRPYGPWPLWRAGAGADAGATRAPAPVLARLGRAGADGSRRRRDRALYKTNWRKWAQRLLRVFALWRGGLGAWLKAPACVPEDAARRERFPQFVFFSSSYVDPLPPWITGNL